MYKVAFVIFLGLLLAFGIDISALVGLIAFLLILLGAFSLLFKGRLPEHFLSSLIGLLIGPILICCAIKALLGQGWGFLGSIFGSTTGALILLVLMAASFLYVRARLTHKESEGRKQLHTNERQPVFPADGHDEG
ncbi:MAG TPA: hypothetical protein VKA70_11495 [Blastocatellia bacterium]|nr:hypothetical protein [Blastocatellia bacterium]